MLCCQPGRWRKGPPAKVRGQLLEAKKARNGQKVPCSLQEGVRPAHSLAVARGDLFRTST